MPHTLTTPRDHRCRRSILNDTGSVAYDVDEAGTIVGIEVLEVQMPGQIALARTFADEHGLAFPRDLAGTPLERHALLVGAAFPVRYDGTGSMHTH
jgi:hypothetical protein